MASAVTPAEPAPAVSDPHPESTPRTETARVIFADDIMPPEQDAVVPDWNGVPAHVDHPKNITDEPRATETAAVQTPHASETPGVAEPEPAPKATATETDTVEVAANTTPNAAHTETVLAETEPELLERAPAAPAPEADQQVADTGLSTAETEEEPIIRRDNDDAADDYDAVAAADTPPPAATTPEPAASTPEPAADKPEPEAVRIEPAAATPADVTPAEVTASEPETAEPVEAAEPVDPEPAVPSKQLIGQGQSLMSSGDVVQARQLFTKSLSTGSPEAALALGRSFDPKYLARVPRANAKPDPAMARKWYEEWYRRSVDQGAISPNVRLERLLQAMNLN